LFVRSGALVTFAISLLLPRPSKIPHDDQWWRIEIGFCLVFAAMQALSLLLVFKYDTPKGCMIKGDKESCKKMLMEMFHDEDRVNKEITNIEKVLEETVF